MDGSPTKVVQKEKEDVIEILEKILSVLKGVDINEEDLVHVKKPLGELESYLKYIPNGPFFNDVLPTEIQERILKLSFPRDDTNAFIAGSVCQQWKKVLKIDDKRKIVCESGERVNPAELMKAVAILKLDVHLVIRKPVTDLVIAEVDPKLLTDALTSVSKLTIGHNYCTGILSAEQFEHLFVNFEKGDKIMEEVELLYLDLRDINQERLSNFLVNKIKRLTLDDGPRNAMGVGTFMSKLLHDSPNQKLSHLTLINIDLFDYFRDDENALTNIAKALCKVENVKLCSPRRPRQITESLMRNILETPIVMKTLIIDPFVMPDFRGTINPQDLKTIFIKMITLKLEGAFTGDQLDAVRSLPDVQVDVGEVYYDRNGRVACYVIKKGSSEML